MEKMKLEQDYQIFSFTIDEHTGNSLVAWLKHWVNFFLIYCAKVDCPFQTKQGE